MGILSTFKISLYDGAEFEINLFDLDSMNSLSTVHIAPPNCPAVLLLKVQLPQVILDDFAIMAPPIVLALFLLKLTFSNTISES